MTSPLLSPAPWPPPVGATVTRPAGPTVVRTEMGQRWGVALQLDPGPGFHALLAGEAWVTLPGQAPQHLTAGDALWVPAGQHHRLSSHPDGHVAPCDERTALRAAQSGSLLSVGLGPLRSRLISIAYEADRRSSFASLHAFTEPVLLRADDDPTRLPLLEILDAEESRRQVGSDAAMAMLTELLLIHLHRTTRARVCSHGPDTSPNPHFDDVTRHAHALIHRHPEVEWTAQSLADAVRVSRATLHRHFTKSLGTTPMTYLSQWRMQHALTLLVDTDEPIGTIAAAVGYASPPAFWRAFKRAHGVSPREYREGALPRSG